LPHFAIATLRRAETLVNIGHAVIASRTNPIGVVVADLNDATAAAAARNKRTDTVC
jgi:hypothetical protein